MVPSLEAPRGQTSDWKSVVGRRWPVGVESQPLSSTRCFQSPSQLVRERIRSKCSRSSPPSVCSRTGERRSAGARSGSAERSSSSNAVHPSVSQLRIGIITGPLDGKERGEGGGSPRRFLYLGCFSLACELPTGGELGLPFPYGSIESPSQASRVRRASWAFLRSTIACASRRC